eukprot:g252.t1
MMCTSLGVEYQIVRGIAMESSLGSFVVFRSVSNIPQSLQLDSPSNPLHPLNVGSDDECLRPSLVGFDSPEIKVEYAQEPRGSEEYPKGSPKGESRQEQVDPEWEDGELDAWLRSLTVAPREGSEETTQEPLSSQFLKTPPKKESTEWHTPSAEVNQGIEELDWESAKVADPRKVFVGGIAWNTTNESFTQVFSQFGAILRFKVVRDSASGAARGYGFVEFQSPSSAVQAVQCERLELDGRRIECKVALPTAVGGQHVRKLFVGGLAKDVSSETLKNHFSQYGEVINAVTMVDRSTARSRGFGFVTFASRESARLALSERHVIGGKRIDVRKALSREHMDKALKRSMQMETSPARSEFGQRKQGSWSSNMYVPGSGHALSNMNSPNRASPIHKRNSPHVVRKRPPLYNLDQATYVNQIGSPHGRALQPRQ